MKWKGPIRRPAPPQAHLNLNTFAVSHFGSKMNGWLLQRRRMPGLTVPIVPAGEPSQSPFHNMRL